MTSANKTTNTMTLTRFLIEEQRRVNATQSGSATGSFTALINDVRLACKRIATLIGKGKLANALGEAGTTNVQGEAQMKLDVMANDIFVRTNEWGGQLAGMQSNRDRIVRRTAPPRVAMQRSDPRPCHRGDVGGRGERSRRVRGGGRARNRRRHGRNRRRLAV